MHLAAEEQRNFAEEQALEKARKQKALLDALKGKKGGTDKKIEKEILKKIEKKNNKQDEEMKEEEIETESEYLLRPSHQATEEDNIKAHFDKINSTQLKKLAENKKLAR